MRNKFKKLSAVLFALLLAFSAFTSVTLQSRTDVYAKTKELWTTMVQKSNDSYGYNLENGSPVAYKVKLNKNTIVVYGSMSDFDSFKTDKVSKHTYKLAKSVKFVSRGGDAPDQKMAKSEFKKYLDAVKDSCLALVLEIKNSKVVCVAVSS